jgi:hypothetical protein
MRVLGAIQLCIRITLMNLRHQIRRPARPALLLWRVSYGNDEVVGEGTVLDMHTIGCRIAGCKPVEAGMRLRLCLWPCQYSKEMFETQGTVKWTRGLQFGLVLDTPQTAMR